MNKRIALPTYCTSHRNAGSISWELASSSGRSGPHARCSCYGSSTRPNRGGNPTQVCFCLRGAAVDASSYHMSDHSCQSTGQRDPGEAGSAGERSNIGPRGWKMQMEKKNAIKKFASKIATVHQEANYC